MPLTPDTRVLITAGAGGIGRAMGAAFAGAGAQVWVTDIDSDALASCPAEWRKTTLDVADGPAMAALFHDIEASWGSLDTLCANAGVAGPTGLIEDIALEDWRSCVSVNLDGAFLAAKYSAAMMKRQRAGSMMLTSSTAGFFGYPHRAPYAAAKWAVIGLMKTLAMELGPHGIRANALCPGAVEGPRMEAVMAREARAKGITRQEVYDGYASGTSMRTWVTGEDIANMAVFLASPEAQFVSGQVIAVDGHTFNPDPKI
jgi:NAD(P)-dependent dehydrogenase (short-subunit alcohol dehydrogenase family)